MHLFLQQKIWSNTKSALAEVVVDSGGVESSSRCTLNKMWILSKIYIDCFQVKVQI